MSTLVDMALVIFECCRLVASRLTSTSTDVRTPEFACSTAQMWHMLILATTITTSTSVNDAGVYGFNMPLKVLSRIDIVLFTGVKNTRPALGNMHVNGFDVSTGIDHAVSGAQAQNMSKVSIHTANSQRREL